MSAIPVKEVEGQLMVGVPDSIVRKLELTSGSLVEIALTEGKILLGPSRRQYDLDELIAMSDPLAFEQTDEDREWLNAPPVGRELI